MATYIEEFVYNLYLGEFRCISFHSSGDWKVDKKCISFSHDLVFFYRDLMMQ